MWFFSPPLIHFLLVCQKSKSIALICITVRTKTRNKSQKNVFDPMYQINNKLDTFDQNLSDMMLCFSRKSNELSSTKGREKTRTHKRGCFGGPERSENKELLLWKSAAIKPPTPPVLLAALFMSPFFTFCLAWILLSPLLCTGKILVSRHKA